VWDHIWPVRWVLPRYLEDVPNSCLRIEDNRVIFQLLTLKGDPEWWYQLAELYPWARDHCPWGKCCWCDWELMGMSVVDLINYLSLEGSHDQECVPTASEEDALPLGNELTDEEGDSKDKGVVHTEAGPIEGEDLEEDPSEQEPMEEKDFGKILAMRKRWKRRSPRRIPARRNKWERRIPRRILK